MVHLALVTDVYEATFGPVNAVCHTLGTDMHDRAVHSAVLNTVRVSPLRRSLNSFCSQTAPSLSFTGSVTMWRPEAWHDVM